MNLIFGQKLLKKKTANKFPEFQYSITALTLDVWQRDYWIYYPNLWQSYYQGDQLC